MDIEVAPWWSLQLKRGKVSVEDATSIDRAVRFQENAGG